MGCSSIGPVATEHLRLYEEGLTQVAFSELPDHPTMRILIVTHAPLTAEFWEGCATVSAIGRFAIALAPTYRCGHRNHFQKTSVGGDPFELCAPVWITSCAPHRVSMKSDAAFFITGAPAVQPLSSRAALSLTCSISGTK